MNERVSYWLLPARPERERLQEIIRDLASRFDAPVFEPHVTVYSSPSRNGDDVRSIVASIAADFSRIELRSIRVAHSEQFTKTLFLEFQDSEELARLNKAVRNRAVAPTNYQLTPHLSLIYAELSLETKESLVHELRFPRSFCFDTLKAIVSREKTRTRQDVENWRVMAEANLGKNA